MIMTIIIITRMLIITTIITIITIIIIIIMWLIRSYTNTKVFFVNIRTELQHANLQYECNNKCPLQLSTYQVITRCKYSIKIFDKSLRSQRIDKCLKIAVHGRFDQGRQRKRLTLGKIEDKTQCLPLLTNSAKSALREQGNFIYLPVPASFITIGVKVARVINTKQTKSRRAPSHRDDVRNINIEDV